MDNYTHRLSAIHHREKSNDVFFTPVDLVQDLLKKVPIEEGDSLLDPFAGPGVWFDVRANADAGAGSGRRRTVRTRGRRSWHWHRHAVAVGSGCAGRSVHDSDRTRIDRPRGFHA